MAWGPSVQAGPGLWHEANGPWAKYNAWVFPESLNSQVHLPGRFSLPPWRMNHFLLSYPAKYSKSCLPFLAKWLNWTRYDENATNGKQFFILVYKSLEISILGEACWRDTPSELNAQSAVWRRRPVLEPQGWREPDSSPWAISRIRHLPTTQTHPESRGRAPEIKIMSVCCPLVALSLITVNCRVTRQRIYYRAVFVKVSSLDEQCWYYLVIYYLWHWWIS